MRLAIMQPYFFPYIGYFQLINAVDQFVIYDNIEFTKKGWINRNRILVNGHNVYITLPLKRDSDYLYICKRFLADSWSSERKTLLNRIANAYRKAPNFKMVFPLIEASVFFDEGNLFRFLFHSLTMVSDYLQIVTPFVISSAIPIDHQLKAEQKVMALCQAMKATEYINPIGGVDLYKKDDFRHAGLELHFIKSSDFIYKQFDDAFVPRLSIIDVMMFNSRDEINRYLSNSYELI